MAIKVRCSITHKSGSRADQPNVRRIVLVSISDNIFAPSTALLLVFLTAVFCLVTQRYFRKKKRLRGGVSTEERYFEQKFCEIEDDISLQLVGLVIRSAISTKPTRPPMRNCIRIHQAAMAW